jgi:glycosyltransferase involved in cell wall biosynthesis
MSAQGRPLVSVVTPVYNGEKYLRECIESVLAQTYKHWEHIIVNNCSSDGTLDIAQEYAARDRRIRIHNNETFVRVIANHNIAFRQISPKSKYCKPLAADDMLLPECLEKMVRLAEEHPNVAIVGAYGLYSRPEMGVYCRGVPYSNSVLSGRELCLKYLLGQGPSVWGPPTFVLFRSEIVRSRHAFYNESNIHADSEACLEFLEHHDFGFVHQILTFMRVQEESLTSLSQRLNTHLPYELYALTKHGPKYLSEGELKQRIRSCLREYYSYLGWQLTKRRGRDFWSFHRGRLAALGYPLSTARLAASTVAYTLGVVLNPKRTAKGVTRLLRESLSRSSEGVRALVG